MHRRHPRCYYYRRDHYCLAGEANIRVDRRYESPRPVGDAPMSIGGRFLDHHDFGSDPRWLKLYYIISHLLAKCCILVVVRFSELVVTPIVLPTRTRDIRGRFSSERPPPPPPQFAVISFVNRLISAIVFRGGGGGVGSANAGEGEGEGAGNKRIVFSFFLKSVEYDVVGQIYHGRGEGGVPYRRARRTFPFPDDALPPPPSPLGSVQPADSGAPGRGRRSPEPTPMAH